MIKKKNKYKKYLVVLLIVTFLFCVSVLVFQTDVFFKSPGNSYVKTISLSSLTKEEVGAGYVVLERYVETPLGVEMVSFKDDKNILFFSINEGEEVKTDLVITIPNDIKTDKYCYNLRTVINDEEFLKKYCFTVR